MVQKLREILLTQYIGAILIALFVWQAAIEVITRSVRLGYRVFEHPQPASVLGFTIADAFPWQEVALSCVTVFLYLLIAYGLARWLYPPVSPTDHAPAESESSPDHSELP